MKAFPLWRFNVAASAALVSLAAAASSARADVGFEFYDDTAGTPVFIAPFTPVGPISYASNANFVDSDYGVGKAYIDSALDGTIYGQVITRDWITIDLPAGGSGYFNGQIQLTGSYAETLNADPGSGPFDASAFVYAGAFAVVAYATPSGTFLRDWTVSGSTRDDYSAVDIVDPIIGPYRSVSHTIVADMQEQIEDDLDLTVTQIQTHQIPSVFGTFNFTMPFESGEIFQFDVGAVCYVYLLHAAGTCDLAHTSKFQGITGVFDASGAAVANYTLTTASGLDAVNGYPGGSGPLLPPPGVPEPSTWSILLLGLGALGAALRGGRRRPQAAPA
jgi:hypothetical protein